MKRILVVGDVMVDRYYNVNRTKSNPECKDGYCLINPIHEGDCMGGAANVAANIQSMGGNVTLLCTTGDTLLLDILKYAKIKVMNAFDKDFICRKDRYVYTEEREEKILIRIDQDPLPNREGRKDALLRMLRHNIEQYDIIVTSDYDKGTLFPKLLDVVASSGKLWIADPKKVFYAAYKNSSDIIIKMNAYEAKEFSFESSVHCDTCSRNKIQDAYTWIVTVAKSIQGVAIMTNGEKSVLRYRASDNHVKMAPVKKVHVKSVIGAGDVFTASLAVSMSDGISIDESISIAIERCSSLISTQERTLVYKR